jgi:LAGLIDADG endonuclease
MAKANLIAPFPVDINRDLFGAYLSGFIDGEGCFVLGYSSPGKKKPSRRTPIASFSVVLRADDCPILRLIQSYLQCGRLYPHIVRNRPNRQFLMSGLSIYRLADLLHIIIPHFGHYPLFAKKRHDFLIWSKGVRLLHRVKSRPRRSLGGHGGTALRWTTTELAQFSSLVVALKAARTFTPH